MLVGLSKKKEKVFLSYCLSDLIVLFLEEKFHLPLDLRHIENLPVSLAALNQEHSFTHSFVKILFSTDVYGTVVSERNVKGSKAWLLSARNWEPMEEIRMVSINNSDARQNMTPGEGTKLPRGHTGTTNPEGGLWETCRDVRPSWIDLWSL